MAGFLSFTVLFLLSCPAWLYYQTFPPAIKKHSTHPPGKTLSFSYAVISDTHDKGICGVSQGRWNDMAIKIINRKKPDFVVGVGDLVAGGGDCKYLWGPANLKNQLKEFKRRILDKLQIPFVPIAGNHDYDTRMSWNKRYAKKEWRKFWRKNRKKVLRSARYSFLGSHRFVHKGIGFSLIDYYGTYGLTKKEMKWVSRNVRKGDFVFRHINPFGLSCDGTSCGFAMRNYSLKPRKLTRTLVKKKVRALFSGHTHAFYDGICDNLRFVNTGSLGKRAMEYIRGWGKSPWRNRQAFVWVDVYTDGTFQVNFYAYHPAWRQMVLFDKRYFPSTIRCYRINRGLYTEGVAATCKTVY